MLCGGAVPVERQPESERGPSWVAGAPQFEIYAFRKSFATIAAASSQSAGDLTPYRGWPTPFYAARTRDSPFSRSSFATCFGVRALIISV